MSNEQMSRGMGMIESAAERAGLRLGSRAVDSFRGVVRLSFKKRSRQVPGLQSCTTKKERSPEL
jgi:hypothetical protein